MAEEPEETDGPWSMETSSWVKSHFLLKRKKKSSTLDNSLEIHCGNEPRIYFFCKMCSTL